jgi:stringent starvation protein B
MMSTESTTSTRPYLIRALYEWCTDNGLTPYVAVRVDDTVQVPHEFVKDGEIVLNISFDATQALKLGNDFIEFTARFGGVARSIIVPMGRVVAIYARENGQGMAFPQPESGQSETVVTPAHRGLVSVGSNAATDEGNSRGMHELPHDTTNTEPPTDPTRPPTGSRPALKRIK